LREKRARRELVEGLGLAVMNIDRVIEIIRSSTNRDQARERLMAEKLGGLAGFLERAGRPADEVAAAKEKEFVTLNERQAKAILDMRLAQLTNTDRQELEDEYKALWARTDYLEGLLADEKKLMGVIVDELNEIKKGYADKRRTQIIDAEGAEILTEDLID